MIATVTILTKCTQLLYIFNHLYCDRNKVPFCYITLKKPQNHSVDSGMHVSVFWAANLIFDFLFYVIPSAGIFLIFFLNEGSTAVFSEAAFDFALLLALYGWATIPLMYIASLFFDRTGDVFSWLTLYHLLTGGLSLP